MTSCPKKDCANGRVPNKKTVNGLTICPLCHGHGSIPVSLSIPKAQVLFFPELGFQKEKRWRAMPEDFVTFGSIRGLPQYSGTAIATDGILVVIEKPDGIKIVGHLDSFEPVKKEKNGNGERKKKPDVNEGLFD